MSPFMYVYMITIYGMLCLYNHLSCYVYITIYVMFICLYNHLCHVMYMITIYVMYDNHLWHLCL